MATERISSDTDTSTAVLDIRGDKEVDAPLQKQFLTQLDQDLDNRLNGWHAGQKNSKTNLAWTWDRFPDPRRADKYLRLRVGHDNAHGLFVGVYVGPVLAKGIQGST